MMRKGILHALVTSVLVGAMACEDDATGPGNGSGGDDSDLSGQITGIRQLSADTVYTVIGVVTVEDGGELRIPAGTTILGSTDVVPSAIIVRQGGRIQANGTATNPIVMTSSKPAGTRQRGDWGGLTINGRARCNFPADECIGEGLSGPYGGTNDADNSGSLSYVRVEFAGFEVSFGNELNAFTFNGVGSGTTMHHLQAHYGSDDGFEWFGGSVDLKYALSTGISDDSFDYSTGWNGRGQFWIAQQDPNDADNGFEVDNNEEDHAAVPLTNPTLYNITLIGKGPNGAGGTAGESTNGLLLRRGTGGKIRNAIVMGFGSSGVDIDSDQTQVQIDAGEFLVANSIIFSNAENFSTDADNFDETAILTQAAWNNRTVDPGLVDPYNRQAPDFRPAAGSAATQGAAAPPNDGFFTVTNFVGGAEPGVAPWYAGWTTVAGS